MENAAVPATNAWIPGGVVGAAVGASAGQDFANHMGAREGRHKDTMTSEEMKAKVRLALEKSVYNVFDFYWEVRSHTRIGLPHFSSLGFLRANCSQHLPLKT